MWSGVGGRAFNSAFRPLCRPKCHPSPSPHLSLQAGGGCDAQREFGCRYWVAVVVVVAVVGILRWCRCGTACAEQLAVYLPPHLERCPAASRCTPTYTISTSPQMNHPNLIKIFEVIEHTSKVGCCEEVRTGVGCCSKAPGNGW